jgi:hypothetical protein
MPVSVGKAFGVYFIGYKFYNDHSVFLTLDSTFPLFSKLVSLD